MMSAQRAVCWAPEPGGPENEPDGPTTGCDTTRPAAMARTRSRDENSTGIGRSTEMKHHARRAVAARAADRDESRDREPGLHTARSDALGASRDRQRAIRIARRVRSPRAGFLLRAQLAEVRRLAHPRESLRCRRLVETGTAGVRGRRCGSGSVVHAGRTYAVFHLDTDHGWYQGAESRHLARESRGGGSVGHAGASARAREFRRRRVVSAAGEGWLALLRFESRRRARQERHLAGAA